MPFVSKPGRFDSDSIIPGRVEDPYGFVTENTVYETPQGPHTHYFSVTGLRQLAERYPQIGLVPVGDLELAREHLASTERLLRQANEAREAAEAKLDRITGLSREGFKVVRQQGRPPQKARA